MIRKSHETPPEMRPLGLQGIYRLFDSARHFGSDYIGVVFRP
jgi:hypothetical protein